MLRVNLNKPRMRVLVCGVDTAVLTWLAATPHETYNALAPLKELARARRDAGNNAPVTYELGGLPWRVAPGASAPWSYALERDKEMTLSVAGSAGLAPGTPTVRAEVRSEYLWAVGYREAMASAQRYAAELLHRPTECLERVARIDLCADFQGWRPSWHTEMVRRFRTHATDSYKQRGIPGRVSQLDWGYGGPLVVRIYDKSKEVVVSKKTWFFGLWSRGSEDYAPDEPVWRLEVQLRGDALEELGLRVDWTHHVEPNLDRIWRYMIGSPLWNPEKESTEERVLRRLQGRIRRRRAKHGEALGLDVVWAKAMRERVADQQKSLGPGAWLTLRAPSRDTNTRRHPIDPRWRVLQEVTWVDPTKLRATREEQLGAALDNLRAQAAGVLSSLGVLRGMSAPLLAADAREQRALLDEAFAHFLELQETHDKLDKRPFGTRIAEKASLRPRIADVVQGAGLDRDRDKWRRRIQAASRTPAEQKLDLRVRARDT